MHPTHAYTTTRTAERREMLVSLFKKALTGIALATLVAAASARDTHPNTPAASARPAETQKYGGKPATAPTWVIHYRVR